MNIFSRTIVISMLSGWAFMTINAAEEKEGIRLQWPKGVTKDAQLKNDLRSFDYALTYLRQTSKREGNWNWYEISRDQLTNLLKTLKIQMYNIEVYDPFVDIVLATLNTYLPEYINQPAAPKNKIQGVTEILELNAEFPGNISSDNINALLQLKKEQELKQQKQLKPVQEKKEVMPEKIKIPEEQKKLSEQPTKQTQTFKEYQEKKKKQMGKK